MYKLYLFDLDGTLFDTYVRIGLHKNNKFVRYIHSDEYHNRIKSDDENYTYEEYTSSKLFKERAKPNYPIIKDCINAIEDKYSDVVIVTARNTMDNLPLFKSVFEKYGMDTSKMIFKFTGDIRDHYGRDNISVAEAKKKAIEEYLYYSEYSYSKMYDDYKSNLDSFLELKENYPTINFETCLVKIGD